MECKGRKDIINENTSFVIYPIFELRLILWWQRVREEDAMLFLCICSTQKWMVTMSASLWTTTWSPKCWGWPVKDSKKGKKFLLIIWFAHRCNFFDLKISPNSYNCDWRKKSAIEVVKKAVFRKGNCREHLMRTLPKDPGLLWVIK